MKLNRLQYDIIRDAMQVISNEMDINIYTMNDRFGNTDPMRYGVNWCAMGTQDAATTLEFAAKLQEAAKIAQMMTELEITYTYEDEGPEIDEETYRKNGRAIIEMIKLQMPEMVVAVLDKMA